MYAIRSYYDSYSVDANIPFNDAGKIHFIPLKNNLTLIRPDVFSGRYQYSNMIYSTFAYSADGTPLTIKPITMIALDFELFQIENEDGLDWSRLELSQVELGSGAATTDEAVTVDLHDEAKTVITSYSIHYTKLYDDQHRWNGVFVHVMDNAWCGLDLLSEHAGNRVF